MTRTVEVLHEVGKGVDRHTVVAVTEVSSHTTWEFVEVHCYDGARVACWPAARENAHAMAIDLAGRLAIRRPPEVVHVAGEGPHRHVVVRVIRGDGAQALDLFEVHPHDSELSRRTRLGLTTAHNQRPTKHILQIADFCVQASLRAAAAKEAADPFKAVLAAAGDRPAATGAFPFRHLRR